jgi:cytochrome b6-f complex iron-sulfur subunit
MFSLRFVRRSRTVQPKIEGARVSLVTGEQPQTRAAPSSSQDERPKASFLSSLLRFIKSKDASSLGTVPRRRRMVICSILGFLGTNLLMFLRYFFPRVLYEPKTVFTIGYPSDFGFGVETKFQNDDRIWVVRNAERLFVIFARCTHLGCTPDWKASENKFKCPCHGSGYDSEGINFEGPAPRPMDRAKIELNAEGQILVDTSVLYEWPKGGQSHFNDPGAYLPL